MDLLTPRQPADPLVTLADAVWVERDATEQLLYRLTVAGLLLAGDDRRYTATALGEVETAVDRLELASLHRATALQALAQAWGVPVDDLTLATVAAQAPDPWSTIFSDHHHRLTVLTEELASTTERNRRLATASLQSVRERLATATGTSTPQIYASVGSSAVAPTPSGRIDQVL